MCGPRRGAIRLWRRWGGGGSAESFAGVWRGTLGLVGNDCGFAADDTLATRLTINQDDTRVVLDATSGATYAGTADDTRLTAVKSDPSDCGGPGGGRTTTQIDMSRDGQPEDRALGVITLSIGCGPLTCSITYLGNLDRVVG